MALTDKNCEPCEDGVEPFTREEEENYLSEISGWSINREEVHKIRKTYEFEDFVEAIDFVNKVAELAESKGHHPNIYIEYNKVTLEVWTHAIDGLSENDFILAAKADNLE